MTRVAAMLSREWAELRLQTTLLFTMAIPAAVIVALPLLVNALTALLPEAQRVGTGLTAEMVGRAAPDLLVLPADAMFQAFLYRQFAVLLLVIPVIAALGIATYSIIGEKQQRSLEPVLATPITTRELLFAKCLSAAIPAVLLTWGAFGVYAGAIVATSLPGVPGAVFTPIVLGIVFLLGPLVAFFALGLGVVVSVRASDPRSAQQFGVVVVFPIVATLVTQLRGLFLLTPAVLFIVAGVLLVASLGVLAVGERLFRRETILTRWR